MPSHTDRARAAYERAKRQQPPNGQPPEPTDDTGDRMAVGLATTCLSTILPKPIRWLVPNRIPLGKLVMVAGDGGQGKSTLILGIVACVTRGLPCLGQQYEPPGRADVLLISCEDDYADTVVPRLKAAGADLHRVFRVDGTRGRKGITLPFCLAHYQEMEEELDARPDVRLVVIDPAGAYVGRSGVDDYNDSELRSLLDPMAELAARKQVTIVIVKHLIKGATARAVHKVSGSVGYVNSVRAAFVVAPDPVDDSRKLFLPLKFNLGPKPSGLAYRLQALDLDTQELIVSSFDHLADEDRQQLASQLFRAEWQGDVDIDADTALGEAKRDRKPGKADEAAEWLQTFLGEFAYPSKEIFAAGSKVGFNEKNLYAAKDLLGIKASNKGRFGGEWHWGMGDAQGWVVRPIVPHP